MSPSARLGGLRLRRLIDGWADAVLASLPVELCSVDGAERPTPRFVRALESGAASFTKSERDRYAFMDLPPGRYRTWARINDADPEPEYVVELRDLVVAQDFAIVAPQPLPLIVLKARTRRDEPSQIARATLMRLQDTRLQTIRATTEALAGGALAVRAHDNNWAMHRPWFEGVSYIARVEVEGFCEQELQLDRLTSDRPALEPWTCVCTHETAPRCGIPRTNSARARRESISSCRASTLSSSTSADSRRRSASRGEPEEFVTFTVLCGPVRDGPLPPNALAARVSDLAGLLASWGFENGGVVIEIAGRSSASLDALWQSIVAAQGLHTSVVVVREGHSHGLAVGPLPSDASALLRLGGTVLPVARE